MPLFLPISGTKLQAKGGLFSNSNSSVQEHTAQNTPNAHTEATADMHFIFYFF